MLVTRPQPGAARTARRLAELGHRPVELPLTKTVALPVDETSLGPAADAVAVTSANALRHAPASLLARLADRPCFAVGERTAAEARERGFRKVTAAAGDAASLAGLIEERVRSGATVAYLTGKVRLGDFEVRAVDAGMNFVVAETYDTQDIDYPPQRLAEIFGAEPIDAVLLYSANAAGCFSRLRRPEGFEDLMARAAYLCMSSRVADRLAKQTKARILVAPEPSEAALLGLLEHVAGRP
ncbi:uroporphyrinogen-III synthase [Mesorhizobium sp. CN2-181]|uniref:uroporphyrinogen-III synthase n=1 Tax=Mesorhizobium yinganensis TaxID=3157707 RepID=UPI0032B86787